MTERRQEATDSASAALATTPYAEIRFRVTQESSGRLLRRLGMTGHTSNAPPSPRDVDSNLQRRATQVAPRACSTDNALSNAYKRTCAGITDALHPVDAA